MSLLCLVTSCFFGGMGEGKVLKGLSFQKKVTFLSSTLKLQVIVGHNFYVIILFILIFIIFIIISVLNKRQAQQIHCVSPDFLHIGCLQTLSLGSQNYYMFVARLQETSSLCHLCLLASSSAQTKISLRQFQEATQPILYTISLISETIWKSLGYYNPGQKRVVQIPPSK